MGVKDKKKKLSDLQNEETTRVRYPKKGEYIGIVEKRLGGSRMNVRSVDGRDILARVPGRAKKFLWIREGDIVLLQPWELDVDKADLVYKYRPNEVRMLEREGKLGNLEQSEEF
jgi:translation initiation factor 1A